jgi:cysteine desulfuration protein SufE
LTDADARVNGENRIPVTMTLPEIQAQLIEDLAVLPSPTERLTVIMEQAGQVELPETSRIEEYRVEGCVSMVWVLPELRNSCCFFQSDADSHLVRGLVHLLCDLYSGHAPEVIITTKFELIDRLGLDRQLSPSRLQGLRAVHAEIIAFAQQCVEL